MQPLTGHPQVIQPAASDWEEKGDLAWSGAGATSALMGAKTATTFTGKVEVATELLLLQLPAAYNTILPL